MRGRWRRRWPATRRACRNGCGGAHRDGRAAPPQAPGSADRRPAPAGARVGGGYAQACRGVGIDVAALGPEGAARRIEDRPALHPYLVAALDDWAGPRHQARPDDPEAVRRLLDVARRVDPDPWRDRLR